MANRGKCCSHTAGLLYKVKDAVTQDFSGTDTVCAWNQSTWKNVVPGSYRTFNNQGQTEDIGKVWKLQLKRLRQMQMWLNTFRPWLAQPYLEPSYILCKLHSHTRMQMLLNYPKIMHNVLYTNVNSADSRYEERVIQGESEVGSGWHCNSQCSLCVGPAHITAAFCYCDVRNMLKWHNLLAEL